VSLTKKESIQLHQQINSKTHLFLDELRALLGTDTTRGGLFSVFDLVQHKPMNKRMIYILMEYFLQNFFLNTSSGQSAATTGGAPSSPMYQNLAAMSAFAAVPLSSPTLPAHYQLTSPLTNLIRLHLSKSSKVKSEWRVNMKKSTSEAVSLSEKSMHGSTSTAHVGMSGSMSNGSISSVEKRHHQRQGSRSGAEQTTPTTTASSRGSISKSKSFYSEVNC
jgi:hypothetical protein